MLANTYAQDPSYIEQAPDEDSHSGTEVPNENVLSIDIVQPTFKYTDSGRITNTMEDLMKEWEQGKKTKEEIMIQIGSKLNEIVQNNTKTIELNTRRFMRDVKKLMIRIPNGEHQKCIAGTNDVQGVFKMRNLAGLKCSDDASRIISINRQWTMLESYINLINKDAKNRVKKCNEETRRMVAIDGCLDTAANLYERFAHGSVIMIHDFQHYARKAVFRLAVRYQTCYDNISSDVLTKFKECLMPKIDNDENLDEDIEKTYNAMKDMTKYIEGITELDQTLPLENLPLRRSTASKKTFKLD